MPKKRRIEEGVQALTVGGGVESACEAVQPVSYTTITSGVEHYIVDLAQHPWHTLIAAASTACEAVVLEATSDSIQVHGRYKHEKGVSGVTFDAQNPSCLYSSGLDGTVRSWDTNAQVCALELRDAESAELNCLDVGENLIVAGSDGAITFWDPRKPETALSRFEETHEKNVTQVLFHPESTDRLLSASEDGLVAVFNTTGSLDEDDGFQGAVNLMDSIARMGFYGSTKQSLWCTTSTEAIYLWDWQAACSENEPGGEGPSASVQNVRLQLNPGCSDEPKDQDLSAIVSLSEGQGGDLSALISARDGCFARAALTTKSQGGSLVLGESKYTGGHSAVVRSCLWPTSARQSLITGGEDGRIAVWDMGFRTHEGKTKRKHK